MFERVVRYFTRLSAWILAVIFCVALTCIVVLSNYLGTKSSLDLLNFEQYALYLDKLLVPYFRVFLKNASMAHLFALTIAMTTAFGLFLAVHIAFSSYNYYRDWRVYLDRRNNADATATFYMMLKELCMLALITIPMVLLINWDIALFRWRSIAGALGIEDPLSATSKIVSWPYQINEFGHLFAWILAKIGAWGYIGATLVVCIGLEYCVMKVGECWMLLVDAFSGSNRNPPPGPRDPLIAEAVAELPSQQDNTGRGNNETPTDDPVQPEPVGEVNNNQQNENAGEGDVLYEVIGDPRMGRVSLQNAIADTDRYWVDPDTRVIWDADYRRRVMGNL